MTLRQSTYQPRAIPDQGLSAELRAFLTQEFRNVSQAVPPNIIRSITGDETQRLQDWVVLADATAGNLTYTLVAPSAAGRFSVTVKKTDASANTVTIAGTIDGVVNLVLAVQYISYTLVSDGAAWWIV